MDTLKKATEINRNNTLKMYAELWNKLKYLIRSITNISGDYDKKYIKIKFNSDDNEIFKWNIKASWFNSSC